MARVSREFLYLFLVYFKLVASLALTVSAIWFNFIDKAMLCVKMLEKPVLILGVIALLSSVIELVWSCCRVKFILWICRISLFLLYLGMFCLTVFSILVTNRNTSRALFGRDGDYSHYLLEKYVMNAEQIKNCLLDFQTCQSIPTGKGADFYKYSLSRTQSSCCKPYTYCDSEFYNATYWTMPKAGLAVADDDCKIWSNVQTELCFNCRSCKTAFYDIIKKYWKIFSLIYFFLLLFYCCLICCNLIIKNRSKGHQRHKVYPV